MDKEMEQKKASDAATGEEACKDPKELAAEYEEAAEQLRKELDEKTKEAEEFRNKYLRKCADFENYKKRMDKEKSALVSFANEELIKELLGVLDNLERALEHFEESPSEEAAVNSLRSGVELTLKNMHDILKKFGLKEIEAMGKPFDPTMHEALSHEESEEYESGIVIKELQKGYLLNERLLRPSLVVVAKGPSGKRESEASN